MFGGWHRPAPPELEPIADEGRFEAVKVVRYRRNRLLGAGYDFADAKIIARRTDVDLHYALDMIQRTADSELARRVVL